MGSYSYYFPLFFAAVGTESVVSGVATSTVSASDSHTEPSSVIQTTGSGRELVVVVASYLAH